MNPSDWIMEPHWWWLIAAALLAFSELVLPGVFLVWLAAAAGITGMVSLLFDLDLPFQLILFALFSLASVYVGRRWYIRHPVASSDPLLNDRAARLIGQTVVVVAAFENGRGRVKVGDSVWNASGPDCEEGAKVRVTGAEGSCLIVESTVIPPPQQPVE
ncbi:NfeD family protein [Sphingosinicella rhizophila]|uniref:NfeD family protein n=1 Tax=Sphingosinicella rhizophila TaxID=3050082 RepID=A0ABU3Q2V1_9SPHN|nr:NfeD family protein [Sphingosinicella sp. GR2756]MDT9597735.1 NfeD family protein [Sphingosinicella sp. GR2756]